MSATGPTAAPSPQPAPPALDALTASNGQLFWVEGRPDGDVLVSWRHGRIRDVLPPGVHASSAVHEYGGGAYVARGHEVWFVRADDQRIWHAAGGALRPVTPLRRHGSARHADLQVSGSGLLVCVRERHDADVVNELVSLPSDGSAEPYVIAQGWDFYSSPRIAPNGSQLAWITWNQPLMPWDGGWLWVADLRPDGLLAEPTLVAGGPDEAVVQPQWSPDGILHYVTDRTGWWNLHKVADGQVTAAISIDAELAVAPWEFGYSTYRFLGNERIATIVQRGARNWLSISHGDDNGSAEPIPLPYTWIKPYLAADRGRLAVIGATPTRAPRVTLVDPVTAASHEIAAGESPSSRVTDAESIRFPTRSGSYSYALLHTAANASSGSSGRVALPLLVRPHPGPTSNAQLRTDAWVSFFTDHGFAVLDVDYAGSTGYGRAFRTALRGNWGVLDVSDCVDAVHHLAAIGWVDPTRVAICGSSAGGYTALRAVATTRTFAAAAVRHAIIDPATWRRTAPKFQAHHADLLIAPPSDHATYQERSVLRHAKAITAPVLIIHGEDDKITSVAEARQLADVLGPYASLITFPDEGHGLRHPSHERQALQAELQHLREALGC